MRPLIVDLGRDYRGGQHQALLLSQGLLARGHAPELVTLGDSLLASRARNAGIKVHGVQMHWRRLGAAIAIRRLLGARGVDIVHANEPHALTAAWLARAHRRVPLVASRRVIFSLSRDAISLARYRASACIIAVSQCVADGTGLPRNKLEVIPDGVPIPKMHSATEREEARRSLGIATDIPLLGCVAALTPDKGQHLLIRALKIIRAQFPDCHLLLVGEGPCRAALHHLVSGQGLEDAVHFAGFVKDLDPVYAAIDLFAFPAQAEGLGSALLMAMASGLPVVALARGGIPEVVENGRNGLLIQESAPEALATEIARLLSNSAEARRLSKSARETILGRFSVDRMVDATLHLYQRLLAER